VVQVDAFVRKKPIAKEWKKSRLNRSQIAALPSFRAVLVCNSLNIKDSICKCLLQNLVFLGRKCYDARCSAATKADFETPKTPALPHLAFLKT